MHTDACLHLYTKLIFNLQPEGELFLERAYPKFAPDETCGQASAPISQPEYLVQYLQMFIHCSRGTTGAKCKVKNLQKYSEL